MKVHLRMVGCRLNQSEIDTMARQLVSIGHEVVSDAEQADQHIVNTCAVTQEATRSSRKLIRELHRANPQAETTVTGCYAQLAAAELAQLPGVRRVVDNGAKAQLVSQITGTWIDEMDSEPHERFSPPGSFGRTRAFVKVQDGCDNACTFCVTTIARGAGRSRPQAAILHEVKSLHRSGYQEVVLTGVHLGSYGHDFGLRRGLQQLVQALLRETAIPRIRLSSLEPWDLTSEFFTLWQDSRLCRHLHLPLQSGCDATLKRMRRHTSQRQFRALVEAARAAIPELRITSDVIVGFPGESAVEFAESLRFIREMDFGGLHVFRYSRRPGTPASRMRGQVGADIKKERSAAVLQCSAEMERRFARRLDGSLGSVLWEQVIAASPEGLQITGYSDNYMRVQTSSAHDLSNQITPARLHAREDGKLYATVEAGLSSPQPVAAR